MDERSTKSTERNGAPAGSDAPEPAREVTRLLAAGKSKQAVERAKEEHKRWRTPESERLLVDAYLGRIAQFHAKGATEDAGALLKLVHERFPAHRGRLQGLQVQSAAAEGRLADLVAPLARPDAPDELRAEIETAIRRQVTDLPALASVVTLPAEHPLPASASAVWRAFEAVTTGPVTDDQIALPEVSRRSPLAGWKLLIRSLAAFYRDDDEGCRRALDGIPADAAVHRLGRLLKATVDGGQTTPGLATVLRDRVVAPDVHLRTALAGIDRAGQIQDTPLLKRSIRAAVAACADARPEMLERLKQHISVRCLFEGAPVDEVLAAMGPSLKDANFWRLMARTSEEFGQSSVSTMYWERFLTHALHEGLVARKSLEEAVVCLHAAGLAARLSRREIQRVRRKLTDGSLFAQYYRDQPPAIARLKPASDQAVMVSAYDANGLFRRAAEIRPDPATFAQWWAWAEQYELEDRYKEEIARYWHFSMPADPEPLLRLSRMAEQRNALKLALKHLSEAEALDAVSPHVRKARLRLTLATAWRHFKDQKAHLVEQDLLALAALPAMAEGDRGALLLALRAAWHAMRSDQPAAQEACDAVVGQMGPWAGGVILSAVGQATRLSKRPAWPAVASVLLPDRFAVAAAAARTIRLAEDLGLAVERPRKWDALINEALRATPNPIPAADLLAIGRAAAKGRALEQGYLASAAGLATANGATAAKFLLLRSASLPLWADDRISQCLRAALELARQSHDAELTASISEAIDRHPSTRGALDDAGGRGLGAEVLAEVLKAEREARFYPHDYTEASRHVVAIANERRPRRPFGFGGGLDLYDDNEDDDYDDAFDEEAPGDWDDEALEPIGPSDPLAGLPPAIRSLMEELTRQYGQLPTPEDLLRTDPKTAKRLLALMGGLSPPGPPGLNAPGGGLPGGGGGLFPRLPGRRSDRKKRRR